MSQDLGRPSRISARPLVSTRSPRSETASSASTATPRSSSTSTTVPVQVMVSPGSSGLLKRQPIEATRSLPPAKRATAETRMPRSSMPLARVGGGEGVGGGGERGVGGGEGGGQRLGLGERVLAGDGLREGAGTLRLDDHAGGPVDATDVAGIRHHAPPCRELWQQQPRGC